jgi:hypothetical protein
MTEDRFKTLSDMLRYLLVRWAAGDLTAWDVQLTAEDIEGQGNTLNCHDGPHETWYEVEESDGRSIPVEVLCTLVDMPARLISTRDIPAFLAFLNTPEGHAAEGWQRWREYWAGIDDIQRRLEQESDQDWPWVS